MSGSMNGPGAVPFEASQIVVLGAGAEHTRRWCRSAIRRPDGPRGRLHRETAQQAPAPANASVQHERHCHGLSVDGAVGAVGE